MKKLILFVCFALPLFAEDAPKSVALAPQSPEQRVVILLRQQRDALSQSLLDTQAQNQLLAAEIESLRQQLTEAQTKLTEASKPKESPKPPAGDAKSSPQPEKK